MPELPEVEAARILARKHCRGLKILKAIVADDDKVIEGIAPRDLEAALTGRTIVEACRKGKQMWLDLGPNSPALMLHFGMTGCLVVKGVDAVKYVNAKAIDPDAWPPKYCKIELELSEGQKLAFCDSRRFARARLQDDPTNNPPVSQLGFDILTDRPTLDQLAAALAKRRSAIKAVALDQSICCGIGNWVADEILHEARIHPSQLASDLSREQLAAFQAALLSVAETAVAVGADDSRYPSHWLFQHRWKPKLAPARLKFLTIGGRTTCFEPAIQKLTSAPAPESEPVDEEGAPKKPTAKRKPAAKKKAAAADTGSAGTLGAEGAAPTKAAAKKPTAAKQSAAARKKAPEGEPARDSGGRGKRGSNSATADAGRDAAAAPGLVSKRRKAAATAR